jgi:pyrroline-5-carboxylate reductase
MTDESHSPRESKYRIGFLGAGNMGAALIEGIIRAHLVKPETIVASCTRIVHDSRLAMTGVGVTTSNLQVVQQSDIIIIAVKPAVIPAVLKEVFDAKQITAEDFQRKCFISIAAGVSIATLESYFQSAGVTGVSIIRVMPNTPCSVGLSASGYSAGVHATMAHKAACEAIFRAVGVIDEVPEKLMDAVTGLSGSGPACQYEYQYYTPAMTMHLEHRSNSF